MKKLLIASSIAAMGLAAAGTANAASKTIDGITFDDGGTVFQIGTVFEDRVLAPGDILSGIGEITSIFESDAATQTWGSGDNGKELTYRFDGFKLQAVTTTVSGAELLFSGGSASFYSDAAQDFTSTSGNQATDIASASGGNLWLSGDAGVRLNCPAGICLDEGIGITLVASVNTATLSAVSGGSGSAFFNLNGGSAFSDFDTNAISGGFDVSANFSFDDSLATDFDLSGSVDARNIPTSVPEPTSMVLLGMGLLGFGFTAHKRKV